MANREEIERISKLSSIIHKREAIWGRAFDNPRSKHGYRAIIGYKPANSVGERWRAKRGLKRIKRNSQDAEVVEMARQEVRNARHTKLQKDGMALDAQFFSEHPFIYLAAGVAFWAALSYGAYRAYGYFAD